jgi:hypothetical protein
VALPALADLAPLIFFTGCLLFCLLCILIVKALFGTASSATSWLPWVGTALSSGLHKAEQHVVNVFAAGASKSESYIGLTWHWSARLVDWFGREINSHANLLLLLADQIPGVGLVHALLTQVHAAAQEISRLWKSVPSTAHAITRPIYGELKALERWTYPRVRAAEHAIDVTIPKDIAGLRSRTKAIEKSLADAWKAIRGLDKVIVDSAFVGAVAVALGFLGLGWLRCNSLGNLGKRFGCGGFQLIEELLAAEVTVLAATDLCDFADAAITLAEAMRPVLVELVDVEDALVGCHGATRPQTLPLPALRLPPNSLGLQLAA